MATLVVFWLTWPASPESGIANRLAGERWYAVSFQNTPIGNYRTRNGRTADGDFEFHTVLRFKLAGNVTTRIEDRLVFQRRPPHRLLRAEHTADTDGVPRRRVTISDAGAEIVENGGRRRVAMTGDLELGDYLAIERWLTDQTPAPGDSHDSRTADFNQLAIVNQRWRILSRDSGGIVIAKGGAANRVYLDTELLPARVEIGDFLVLQRVADEDAARAWERSAPVLSATSANPLTSPTATALQVPVDKAIVNPTALRHLVVAVDHAAGRGGAWRDAWQSTLLTADAYPRSPASGAEMASASVATVSYPATDARLRELAEGAVAGLHSAADKANALTLFVHGHLRYRDTARAATVFDTIRDRSGDCTEFADLYTTLARAVGLPARTVIGLAYHDDTQAFALHAWNEVAIDLAWHGVDPTWGQTRLGATRFTLPADAALAAIAEIPRLRFQVVEARY